MNILTKWRVGGFAAIAASVLVLLGIAFLTLAATRSLPAIDGTITTIENPDKQPVKFSWPDHGWAAIGTLDGGLKSTFGDNAPHPTASLAKTITALVVLDAKPLDGDGPLITITADDIGLYRQTIAANGSRLYVEEGEQLSERQMIEAMMLPSANNIADGLAIWAFGSLENYRTAAEAWLTKNNLAATAIGADASGLDPGTTSSVTDLFEIGRLALQHPVLSEIVREATAEFPLEGQLLNGNQLLRDNAGYIGIKTGNSDQAKSCLLFAVEQTAGNSTVTVIGVLLGQNLGTTFNAARALRQSAADNLIEYKIPAGATVGRYQIPWGGDVSAVTTNNISGVIWRDEDPTPTITLDEIQPPVYSNNIVGNVRFGDQASDVRLNGIILTPSLPWKIQNLSQLQWR